MNVLPVLYNLINGVYYTYLFGDIICFGIKLNYNGYFVKFVNLNSFFYINYHII